jgi:capsular polysaccharide biosynthesis protein
MENQQQGEQMTVLQIAGAPDRPSFPNRLLFAAAGLAGGLGIGFLLGVWLEISDRSIRTERDAEAVMDLPLLISVPWLGDENEVSSNGNGQRKFWSRSQTADKDKVEV